VTLARATVTLTANQARELTEQVKADAAVAFGRSGGGREAA
jgi:hypothetical protein